MNSRWYSKFLVRLVTSLIIFSLFINPAMAAGGDTTRVSVASDSTQGNNESREPTISTTLNSSPIMFIENVGQFGSPASSPMPVALAQAGQGSGARFQVRGSNGTIWLAEDALWLTALEKPSSPQTPSSSPVEGEASPQVAITEFTIPTANSHPYEIAAGSDGNLWFTEFDANKIGRITPSGAITEYSLPTSSWMRGITNGPDGALWFTRQDTKQIGRITADGVITLYSTNGSPYDITRGPDGALWFIEGYTSIGRITTSGTITEFTVPNIGCLWKITSGPDGALWFTDWHRNNIGWITTAGVSTLYKLLTGSYSDAITSGPDGNLWFTQWPDSIGKITPSGTITEYPLPSGSYLSDITLGPDGALWFTEFYGNKIGRITTDGTLTEYPIPTANGHPNGLTTGPDGSIWFTENGANKIGKLILSSISIALVRDEFGNPISGAQVFRNGTLAGTTTANGILFIPDLASGDQLVARQQVTEVPSRKNNHNQDSTQNWAYRVYITSLDIPQNGEPTPWVVTDPSISQTLTIKKSNPLIGFNIVASVEWDADSIYLNALQQGFQSASNYLYDATDGQMLFEQVTIYDDNQIMGDADYQVRASNQEWPRANVSGILSGDNLHVFLGRYFDGQSANQGSWTASNGYRTQIHEFGHYGLGLYDSYFYYDNGENKHDSDCTSAAIRTNQTPDINATLMDYQYNASEFSMQNVSGLWSSQCQETDQWKKNGQSDWETIVGHYQDTSSPARWEMKTPTSYGGVVSGPGLQPVSGWSTAGVGRDASTGVCEPPPTYRIEHVWGAPARGASVVLRKGDRTIDQGKTDDNGEITVLGASDGDRVVVNLWGIDLRINSIEVDCSALSQSRAVSIQPTAIILQPAAFTLEISTAPGVAANQVEIIVKASTELSGAPETYLTQNGAASAVLVPLSYDAVLQAYMGTVALDANLPPSGNIIAEATNTASQTVEVATQFAIEPIAADQDSTVWSSDGQAELYLPAGSLSADGRVTIVAGQIASSLPDGLILIGGLYTIQGSESLTLVNNVNLSLYYLDVGGTLSHVDANSAQIYQWDGQSWQPLTSTSSQVEQMVSAAINTFGTYALMAERQEKIYLPLVTR